MVKNITVKFEHGEDATKTHRAKGDAPMLLLTVQSKHYKKMKSHP